jgi:hypothetical protein
MRGESTSSRHARNAGQFGTHEAQAPARRNATFQHEGTNLIDDPGPLRDEPLAHAMQRLQIQLLGRLRRNDFMVGRCTASAIASASRKSSSVLRYLKTINDELGITVLLNIHQVNYAREFGRRIVGLSGGVIAFDGDVSGLTDRVLNDIYGGRPEDSHDE